MLERKPTGLALGLTVILGYAVAVAVLYGLVVVLLSGGESEEDGLPEFNDTTVHALCASCHAFPEPDILPRASWWQVIHKMTKMPGYPTHAAPTDSLARWYESRAPERIELPPERHVPEINPLRWQRSSFPADYGPNYPFIANLQFVDLFDDARLELVVTDMSQGAVLVGRPYASPTVLDQFGFIPNPAHIEPVDLDRDGRLDFVAGNLGSLPPMDHDLGSVDWLRADETGRFERIVLLEGLGRVADTRPGDFDNDGDWDLTVGEFGYRRTGQIGVLENQMGEGGGQSPTTRPPPFQFHQLDARHGVIHTEVTDLNDDGQADIVAILAQEFEMVVAYLNQGAFTFQTLELYHAPHPAWGTSGMQLVDLDGDDDLDILMTNGDMFDDPSLKIYHGISWLEQTAPLQFTRHHLARMYAAHRAFAGDLDGDGDLDIAAGSFMPKSIHREALEAGLHFQTLIWLEQTSAGEFVPHSLEQDRPAHSTLVLGDYDLDGDVDLAVGDAYFNTGAVPDSVQAVELWENLGRAPTE